MGSDSGKSVAGKPFSCNSHRQGSKVEVFDKTGFMAQTSKESALLHLVLPVFQLCRWTLYTPTSIHNNNEGAIVVKEGSLVRKVLVVLFQIGMMIKILGLSCRNETFLHGNVKIMYRFVAFAYLFYNVSEFWALNRKMCNILQLFQRVENLERDLLALGGKLPSVRTAKKVGWTIVTVWMLFAIAFAFNSRMGIGSLFIEGISRWAEDAAGIAMQEGNLLLGLNASYAPQDHSTMVNLALASPLVLFSILYDLHWVTGFLMLLMWGLVFDKMLQSFFKVFEETGRLHGSAVQDIRKFSDIVFAIDSFNGIFGTMIFGAILSGGSHFSVYLMTVFKSESGVVDAVFTVTCFIAFWSQLLVGAEVSRSAGIMTNVIKNRFHSDETWTEENVSDPRTTHGLIILYADLSNSNVGFEGLGYFTVTYSLIGSVLSLIVTYAIVALQMN